MVCQIKTVELKNKLNFLKNMLPEVKIEKKTFMLDLSQLPTPCYVIDLNIVKQNLQLLRKIKEQTSVNILLALKAFSLNKNWTNDI